MGEVRVGDCHTSVLEVGSRVAPQAFMLHSQDQLSETSRGQDTFDIESLTQMGH